MSWSRYVRIPLRARSTSRKISLFLREASFSMPASRPSSSSDTRVMPSRPTIESAPCAWCRCDWLALSCAASALFAANARSASWARWTAWSISPLTQESGPTSKSARAVLRGGGGVLRVRLKGLEDRADLLGRFGGPPRETLHFFRNHREPTPGLARGGRLDRGVQSENVGLLGNVRNQLDDLADFLRGFAQSLDALGRLLDLLADFVHARDRVLHRLRAFLRGSERLACHAGRLRSALRHLVHGLCHAEDRSAGLANLDGLLFRGGEQLRGRMLRRLGSGRHLSGGGEKQSVEIRQTSASVLGMAKAMNEMSESASQSASVARQSLAAAQKGTQAVQNSISGMNEIREQIQETSKRIKRLGESSQEIGEIVH